MNQLILSAVLTLPLATACAYQPSIEAKRNLYEVESNARKMTPQEDSGLLYLIAPERRQPGLTTIHINGNIAMRGLLHDNFYVFCIPPGKYDIKYEADVLIPNKSEFVEIAKSQIYVRQFDQLFAAIFIIPLSGSKLESVDYEQAKQRVSTLRLGQDEAYVNSQYRCRSFKT